MIEYYIWVIAFITIYVSIFWISVMFIEDVKKPKLDKFPFVSLIVPALNEENVIKNTIDSLLSLNYPKDKVEIIVVDDGSTDKTKEIVSAYKDKRVRLILNEHKGVGKASALNKGILNAKGEIVGCVDADCYADNNSLMNMVGHFNSDEVGAVITPVKVLNTRTFFERMQRIEYILTSFIRRLMSYVGTLQVTPGALSLYKKKVIKKIGYFDENNLTEDYEIALRLINNRYKVVMESSIDTHTYVPENFNDLWTQRVRWFRGFILNNMKYKHMFMNRKYGLTGTFQTPINFFSLFVVFISLVLLGYHLFKWLYNLITRILILEWDIFDLFKFPTVKELILNINLKILFPVVVAFLFGLYIYYKAHQYTKEKIKFPIAIFIYLFIYPFLRTAQWVNALLAETFNLKKKW